MQRKPTKRKVIEGDAGMRGKHVLAAKLAAEPHAQDGLPPAPKHLPKRAREVFEFWREQLELMQIDHRPDAQALEAASMAYCRAVEAELVVTREGSVVSEPVFYKGAPVPGAFRKKRHPASTVAQVNWMLVKQFVVEFGLTPAARSRITVDRKPSSDTDLAKLLSGPRLTAEERAKLQ
jgi:P27 family predicted phage terminase small subunit